jgi:hypothetical protein
MEGKFFVSPGSATGAFSSGGWGEGEEAVPSFVLMDVSAGRIVSHIFLPKGGNVWRIVEIANGTTGPRRRGGLLRISAQEG